MIHADLHEYGGQSALYHIGGVRHAAHTTLQHHHVALHFPEIQKGHSRLRLERGGVDETIPQHLLSRLPHLLCQPSTASSVIYPHSPGIRLPVIENYRGQITSCPVARFF